MYQNYKNQIATPCAEQSKPAWIIFENGLYLTLWSLAGALLWPIKVSNIPIAAVFWAVFIITIQILLKKHVCSGCYYFGKSCHLGWGRLSAALFVQDSGNSKLGEYLALTCYIAAPVLVLIAGIAVGLLENVGVAHWGILGGFVAINTVLGVIRPISCRKCAMRTVCPGSAAKQKRQRV